MGTMWGMSNVQCAIINVELGIEEGEGNAVCVYARNVEL